MEENNSKKEISYGSAKVGRPKHEYIPSLKEAGIEIITRPEAGLDLSIQEITNAIVEGAKTLNELQVIKKDCKDIRIANQLRSRLYESIDTEKFIISIRGKVVYVYLEKVI